MLSQLQPLHLTHIPTHIPISPYHKKNASKKKFLISKKKNFQQTSKRKFSRKKFKKKKKYMKKKKKKWKFDVEISIGISSSHVVK